MKKDEEIIIEENNTKSIVAILIGIVIVLGLIFLTIFLSKDDEEVKLDDVIKDTKIDIVEKIDSEEENTSNVVALSSKKYTVVFLDVDGNQIGKTQKVLSLKDVKNEKAPKINGMRFTEWVKEYSEEDDTYYFIASYRQNVEKIEEKEEKHIKYKSKSPLCAASQFREENDVIIEGEIPLVEETDEEVTISNEYEHILALRVNAPEDITKENIENMTIEVRPENEQDALSEDQYSYNGEDKNKSGRDLLDSTDEEYENNIFYFYYYQETDTKTNTTLEVYWGNDEEANKDESKEVEDKYIETYNIKFDNVENEEKSEQNEEE